MKREKEEETEREKKSKREREKQRDCCHEICDYEGMRYGINYYFGKKVEEFIYY